VNIVSEPTKQSGDHNTDKYGDLNENHKGSSANHPGLSCRYITVFTAYVMPIRIVRKAEKRDTR